MNDLYNTTEDGVYLGFLHKNLSIGDAVYGLLRSKRFTQRLSELSKTDVTIDDALVYSEICKLAFPIFERVGKYSRLEDFKADFIAENGKDACVSFLYDYKVFYRALIKLSGVLFSNPDHWKDEYEESVGVEFVRPTRKSEIIEIPAGNEDIAYILDVCCKLSRSSLRYIVSDEGIVNALRKKGVVCSMEEAFDVIKRVFYKCVRLGFKNRDDESRTIYLKRRNIVMDFCKKIYGDKNYWHDDYAQSVDSLF